MRRTARGLCGIVICLVLTGCTGSSDAPDTTSGDGPDDGAGTAAAPAAQRHRAQCTVSDPEGEIIVQPGSLTATGELTLDGVTLDSAVNLDVVEQSVVRFTGRSTISGIIRDYPPLKNAGLADSLADWDQRRDLAGLTLGADDGQQAVLVAVRLTDPTRPGHLNGVVLRTSQGERSYAQPVLVEPPGGLCTVEAYDSTLEWVP